MEIKDLIGFQLAEINDSEIKLKKGDKTFTLSIIDSCEEEQLCCEYNDITANLLISEEELSRNPIITDITIDRKEINIDGETDPCGQTCTVVFFGEEKNIAKVETTSSSSSWWQYGACASVKCKELDLNEVLSEW